MKDINTQLSDFEYEYIQEYAAQFNVMLNLNSLHNNYPNIKNKYSHLKQLFFFPSNRSNNKQQRIYEKYTQFNNNRIFLLLKIAVDNTPLTFEFIEAELISYQNTDIIVDINIPLSDHFNNHEYNIHANKKNGQQLTRQQLICFNASNRFKSLFKVNLKHICDLRLSY